MPCRKLVYGESPPAGQTAYGSFNDCDNNSCCQGSSSIMRNSYSNNCGLNGPCPEYCVSHCDWAWYPNCNFMAGPTWIGCVAPAIVNCVAEQNPPPISEFCNGRDAKTPSEEILNSPYLIISNNVYIWRSPSICS